MHCQHLSQLLDDIMDLQTQNPRKYVKHLRFSGQILFCKIFPKKRIGHSMFAQERGASIQILMFVFLFCNSSKRKRLFSPAKNSASKCQHNFASRERKAESSIFLVIAQRVKHFLLLKEKCQVAISRSWKETNEKYLSLSKRCLKSQGCLALSTLVELSKTKLHLNNQTRAHTLDESLL